MATPDDVPPEPLLARVHIKNFRSIAECCIDLGRVNLLVGRNGAGKSNFLDAIRFVKDSLDSSLDHALRDRGGKEAVVRKSQGHPRSVAIELALNLSHGAVARYGFEIAMRRGDQGFAVVRERLDGTTANNKWFGFDVKRGEVKRSSIGDFPRLAEDSLALIRTSSVARFGEVFDLLTRMGFYNLNPVAMKDIQDPDSGELLRSDGSNIASVIGRMDRTRLDRLESFLQSVVAGIHGIQRKRLGPKETLEFKQTVKGDPRPWSFYAQNMSDGTLRTLGILTAISQGAARSGRVRLVGIEEPETALHPAAAGALVDAIQEATPHTQVLVTTHSPDLLDHPKVRAEWIRVVVAEEGITTITSPDPASTSAIQEHLYSAGELLRQDQLDQDEEERRQQQDLPFFDDAAAATTDS